MSASTYPVASGLDSYGAPPVLIAASSEIAARRAAETAAGAEMPFFSVSIEGALARLDLQSCAAAVWLELEDDSKAELDRIDAEVGAGQFPAVIAAPQSMIDLIVARVRNSDIEVVIDGTPVDRAAALALA